MSMTQQTTNVLKEKLDVAVCSKEKLDVVISRITYIIMNWKKDVCIMLPKF